MAAKKFISYACKPLYLFSRICRSTSAKACSPSRLSPCHYSSSGRAVFSAIRSTVLKVASNWLAIVYSTSQPALKKSIDWGEEEEEGNEEEEREEEEDRQGDAGNS